MTTCPCGHPQTEDGWCEVVIGSSVHEIPRDGLAVCRLCGSQFAELEEST